MAYDFHKLYGSESDNDIDRTVELVRKAGDTARKALNSVEFVEYKKSYENAEKAMVDSMLAYTDAFFCNGTDLALYGAKIARMMTKLQDLKVLLNKVENDVKRLDLMEKEIDNA